MNAKECGKLLAQMAAYDYRDVDAVIVGSWLQVVGDLPYDDARAAVLAHYAASSERMMPAHLRQRVRAMRADRLARAIPEAPPAELADQPGRYRQAIQAGIRRIADGFRPPKAITAGPLPGEPPRAWQDARAAIGAGTTQAPDKARDPREIAAEQVRQSRAARARAGDAP